MRPVHEFKANSITVLPAEPATDGLSGESAHNQPVLHETDSDVRNLCFAWPDGRRAFFNYAYLVSGDLSLGDELNVMRLVFSGYTVTLKGYHLQLLFELLLTHSPKIVTAIQPRYITVDNQDAPWVIDIQIMSE